MLSCLVPMPHPAELTALLHRALEPRLERLLELCGTAGWQADPEALHQVRIASRRVRAVLDLADPDTYPGFKKHRRHLRQLTKALGLTRELDVHAARLEALAGRLPEPLHQAVIEHLLQGLEGRRAKARRHMARDLGRTPWKDLDRLRIAPQEPPDPVNASRLPRCAWACLEPWVRAVEAPLPGLLGREDVEGLHQLRIQLKRLRYTLEILEPAFPTPLADPLQRLRALQTALGEHHDHSVLEVHLRAVQGTLAANRRAVLASGVQGLLAVTAEERRVQFLQVQRLGQELRDTDLLAHLGRLLLPSPRTSE